MEAFVVNGMGTNEFYLCCGVCFGDVQCPIECALFLDVFEAFRSCFKR